MFADRKAHAVGDVITVLITENTVASQDADTNTSKDVKATAKKYLRANAVVISVIKPEKP